jgi:hypothetical protein
MEMSSLLSLNAIDCAIGDFLVGFPVQRHPDRKAARRVVPNNLNAANRLAPGPMSNSLQALFSESPVAESDCFRLHAGGSPPSATNRNFSEFFISPNVTITAFPFTASCSVKKGSRDRTAH